MEYLGNLVLRVHKDQLVPMESLVLLDQKDQVAHLGSLDNQEIEVTPVLMVKKVRLAGQAWAAALVTQVRLDRLVHKDQWADRDLSVHLVNLVRKAHKGIMDRLEALDHLDPREAQVEPVQLGQLGPLDVLDQLEQQEQRGLLGHLGQQDTVGLLVRLGVLVSEENWVCLDSQVEQGTQEPLDLQVRSVQRASQERPVHWEQLDLPGAWEERDLLDHVEELEQELQLSLRTWRMPH